MEMNPFRSYDLQKSQKNSLLKNQIEVPQYKDARQFGLMAVWIHGSLDSWQFGFMAVWIHGSLDSWQFAKLPIPLQPVAFQSQNAFCALNLYSC